MLLIKVCIYYISCVKIYCLTIFLQSTTIVATSSLPDVNWYLILGCVAHSVTGLTADPGVGNMIPARSLTFVEIDHEIVSTAISSLPLIQEGLLSVTSESMCTKFWLTA